MSTATGFVDGKLRNKTMPDRESKILRDFLTSPLSVDDAVSRLVALGYQEGDAEDLVGEWIEAEHAKEGA
jgi:hypothetical protein